MKSICITSFIHLLLSTFIFSQTPATPTVGNAPPNLEISVIKPDTIQIDSWQDLKGKTVVLDFWATWCTPCIAEFPRINNLLEAFDSDDVVFISLTYEPEDMILPFLRRHKLNTIIASDTSFSMFKSFDGWAIPLVFLINKDGMIAARMHPANLTKEILTTVIKGQVPEIEQVPIGLYDSAGAEEHFRSFLKRSTTE